MKKFRMCLLTLCCCLLIATAFTTVTFAASAENCPGNCSHGAAIGTTHYDTLAEALTAATDDCTVTLLADVTTEPITLGKSITLDLGEKTLAGSLGEDEALLNVTGNLTLTNGTLTATNGTAISAADCAVIIDKTTSIHADVNALELRGSGNLTITGGTLTAKENLIVMDIADEKAMEATITGGKFHAENGETILITKGKDATAPEGFVTGGTFNKLPTDYIPAYCRTTDNGDSTYTVTAEYSVSVSGNGGSGTMAPIKADRGTTITLPKCTLTAPAGKHFKAWQIGDKTYAPGATYAINGDVTITALWESHSGGSASCVKKAACSVCGATYGSYSSHYLTASSGYAATCDSAGMNAHTKCSTCGQYFIGGVQISASSLTIPALGHDMKPVPGKEATCTEEGIQAHEKCSLCEQLQIQGEDITKEDLIIDAKGHTLETVSAVEPTCVQPGVAAHEKCAECDILFVKGQETTESELSVPVVSHVLSDWEQDAATHWKACTGCGEVFRQHSHADTDANAACDECGYEMAVSQEAAPQQQKSFSFLFLIPMVVAVAIGAGVAIKAAKKKAQ